MKDRLMKFAGGFSNKCAPLREFFAGFNWFAVVDIFRTLRFRVHARDGEMNGTQSRARALN